MARSDARSGGRVANYQANSEDEMQRSGAIPPELIARIAPTRTEGINMRGVFRFPIEQYAEQLLPSRVLPKIHVLGQ